MAQEPSIVEQAVARALRDNLERIQRTTDELHHAVNDVVSACSSNKPTNALPPMLRAQTAAASIAAALEVLTRFVASSLQSGTKSAVEHAAERFGERATSDTQSMSYAGPASVAAAPPPPRAQPGHPASMAPESASSGAELEPLPETHIEELEHEGAHFEAAPELPYDSGNQSLPHSASAAAISAEAGAGDFDINRLTPEEQELHRRANRVAKVSMQDIKMLRPEQVKQGRENRDLCIRLKDDIEKAHREYDRRFKPIMDHPVDYFYRWMVEILAEGDAHALGEYPYATSAPRR
ncbi:MAG TPA: hypothetical protein VKF79_02840 [Candidatus Acidoferrum sp.]|nr:hypothetical protein [Candidatus Acidoferrum sp.]